MATVAVDDSSILARSGPKTLGLIMLTFQHTGQHIVMFSGCLSVPSFHTAVGVDNDADDELAYCTYVCTNSLICGCVSVRADVASTVILLLVQQVVLLQIPDYKHSYIGEFLGS